MKLLLGADLIDGTGAPPLRDSAVLVEDGRIAWTGRQDARPFPDEAQVFDLTGMTLMPGLIDCHDHLAIHSYDLLGRWGMHEPESTQHLRTAETVQDTLSRGYTTLRDAGGLDVGYKLAIEEGLISGPNLVLAVTIISPTGHLADLCSLSGHPGPAPIDPLTPSGVVDGVDGVRSKVREVVRAGADVIKYVGTGGVRYRPGYGPLEVAFDRDETRALVDQAHLLGRRVMCHAFGGPGVRFAIEAGVDSIEHAGYLDQEPDLIAMMAEMGIFYVPTITNALHHRDEGAPHMRRFASHMYPHLVESVRRTLAGGVKVVAGCDAGAFRHGLNAHELQHLVAAGLSPMQAVVAATGWAAECLGVEDRAGTVSLGKAADLVAVDGDPLEDIGLLKDKKRIRLVLKAGEVCADTLDRGAGAVSPHR